LTRVRRQSLDNAINSKAFNSVSDVSNYTPDRSISTTSLSGTFTDQATKFANDLATETQTFLTGNVINGVPNYWLVIGGLALLAVFKGGGAYHRR
jgi:hypothetical protein